MISRFTRRQLIAFALITALSTSVMGAYYVHIPQMLGFGRYELLVDLPRSGGLYAKSVVTYRGHDIGVVERLELRDDGGVRATLSVDDDAKIPGNADVQVRSASAIGEQYLNFEPRTTPTAALTDGDVVVAGDDVIPVSTGELLTSVESFFASVPRKALVTTIDELDEAFAGGGDDLGRLLDAGSGFQAAANENLPQTLGLIRSMDPVLATQQSLDQEIRSWAGGLDLFTETLAVSDADVRSLLETGPPLAEEVVALARDLRRSLPQLLTDLSLAGQVAQVYLPNIEHTLAVLPAAIEMHYAALPESRKDDAYPEANLSFKMQANDPPTCSVGFTDKARSPKDLTPAKAPQDSYCKVPHQDPRVVRGARNQACPNGGYGATARDCGLVFQQAAKASAAMLASGQAAYDPNTGRFLAPNGTFYLIDQANTGTAPLSWQQLLIGLVGT